MNKGFLLAILATITFQSFVLAQDCPFGFCDFGYGIQTYNNGERYVGQFYNSKKNGQGVYFFSNGDKYVGTWKDDAFHGEGRFYRKDGSIESGIWTAGQLKTTAPIQSKCILGDCQNGYGIFLFENGVKLAADFQNGAANNQVTVFYPNGAKYVGDWKSQAKDGFGVLYHANGTIEEGFWKEDKYTGLSKSLKGCVKGNCENGEGTYVYRDNTKYEGAFRNSFAHGYGVCFYSDGDLYIGEWKHHNFDGKGTMYHSDGTIQNGYWRAGVFLGETAPEAPTRSLSGKETPKVYAILVGVARYDHMKALKYTDDDAYRMYAFLKSPEGGALQDEQIRILIDEDATKNKILTTVRETFAKAGPNDVVFFYFSGHGLKGAFLPIDFDGNNNKLEHRELLELLNQCQAKSKVVIADACHSGSLQNSTAKGSVQSVIETYYQAFSESSGGTVLMMSSKAEETSIENNGLRQGIFSHFLIRGLKGAADNNDDKIITINELFEYVEANVRFYTNNYQSPVIHGEYDQKMPLGVVRD